MDATPNKYITVAYELYTDFDGKKELVEKAPIEHPFQFISDMGTTLDAFEAQIKPLQKGEKFNFTLSVEEAYGEYEQERVLELNKDVFKINGHFDKEHIYPGSVVPLMNADGARFNGTITDVKEDTVTVDLNQITENWLQRADIMPRPWMYMRRSRPKRKIRFLRLKM